MLIKDKKNFISRSHRTTELEMGGNNYNWLIAFGAGMGGLLFGYEIGVIGYVRH